MRSAIACARVIRVPAIRCDAELPHLVERALAGPGLDATGGLALTMAGFSARELAVLEALAETFVAGGGAEQSLGPLAQRGIGAAGLVQIGRPFGRIVFFQRGQKNLAFGHDSLTWLAKRAATP